MAENTDFRIDKYTYKKKEGRKESAFSVNKGKTMVFAMRLLSHKSTKLRIKTPTAVADVRGTKFAVGVFWEKEKRAEIGVMVADQGNDLGNYLAQSGGGGSSSHTDFHSFDGNLQVTAQVNGNRVQRFVSSGNSFNGSTGSVGNTPANIANQYNQVTTVTTQGTGQGSTGQGGTTGGTQTGGVNVLGTTGTGGQGNQGNLADLTANLSNTTQQQTGSNTTQGGAATLTEPEPGPLTGTVKGYFAALLSNHSGADPDNPIVPYDVFVPTAIQETTSDTVQAFGLESLNIDYLIYDDSTGFREASILPADPEAIDVPVDGWTLVKIVDNAYQWGYWEGSDTQFTIDEALNFFGPYGPYAIDNKVWLIEGYPTSDSIMNAKTGSYAYSFDVDGTFWSTTGGIDLSGSGSCNVNFTSDTISNFGFEALSSDNQQGAKVSAGTGNITGSTFGIGGGAVYQLKSAGGNYQGVTYGSVEGAFYGDNAYMGFAWGMSDSTAKMGAAGVGHDARNQ